MYKFYLNALLTNYEYESHITKCSFQHAFNMLTNNCYSTYCNFIKDSNNYAYEYVLIMIRSNKDT